MAATITVSVGGDPADKTLPPQGAIRRAGRTVAQLKPGETRENVQYPCEVYGRSGLRITNTSPHTLHVGPVAVAPGASITPPLKQWMHVR